MPENLAKSSSPDPERLAERAWRLHTDLPTGPTEWFDLLEAFVEQARPRDPERTAAVLLLALHNARGWDRFVDGGWIYLAGVHVYIHFVGQGIGDMRTLQIADRFLVWLGRMGRLHEWDLACLRHRLDQQRVCHGGKAKGIPRAFDVQLGIRRVEDLAAEFVAAHPQEHSTRVVEGAIQTLAEATRLRGTTVVRFGALNTPSLWALCLEGSEGTPEDLEFVRAVARIGAGFYRWLADEDHLEPARARLVEQQLLRVAALPPGRPGAGA